MAGADLEKVWAVTCFFVAKTHRRIGLMTELAQAACEFAAEAGAQAVEAAALKPKDKLQWSDGFVATGQAIVALVKGIAAISTELALLTKAWVALKITRWVGGLRGVAAAVIGVGQGATTATVAVKAMTAALRVTLIGAAIELLGRLAGAYFDLKQAVEEDEKKGRRTWYRRDLGSDATKDTLVLAFRVHDPLRVLGGVLNDRLHDQA